MKLCKKGLHSHNDLYCKECKKIATKKWQTSNPQKVIEASKKWKAVNPEKQKECTNNWRKNNPDFYKQACATRNKRWKLENPDYNWHFQNPEKSKECSNRWKQANPAKGNAAKARRRAAKLQATPKWLTVFDLQYIAHLYIQAKELEKIDGIVYEVDHIIPLNPMNKSVCGLHVPWNLQILTKTENAKKKDNYCQRG